MPITDTTRRVAITDIKVLRSERQRRQISTADLESSIRSIGLLQPIIISSDLVLKAGERRLTACRNLGHQDILCRFAESLTDTEAQIIELEENLKREDLPWRDTVRALARIHQLFCEMDPDWAQQQTAERLSLTPGTVSLYLRVFPDIDDERLANADTIREAYNVLSRRDQRAAGDALQELLETPDTLPGVSLYSPTDLPSITPGSATIQVVGTGVAFKATAAEPTAEESIQQADFLEWAPRYTGPKFSFIHCDFPYGIDFASSAQGLGSETTTYNDSKDTYVNLLECLCQQIDRLMSVSAHLMFWYSAKHHQLTMERFSRLASLEFHVYPLIWLKSDNAGIAGDARRHPRHIYETCLFASRGRRQIVKIMADAYSAPTDKRLHVSTKPEPMLRHFMSMVVDEHTSMLDPTCGSGAAIRAAESLGAKLALGLEIDPESCRLAQQDLKRVRLARKAEAALK